MNKKKINKYEEDSIDLIKILSIIIINKNTVVKFLLFSFIVGLIISVVTPVKYKSQSKFYPHYDNMDKSGTDLKNLAGLAGINLQEDNSNQIPTNLYPEIIVDLAKSVFEQRNKEMRIISLM